MGDQEGLPGRIVSPEVYIASDIGHVRRNTDGNFSAVRCREQITSQVPVSRQDFARMFGRIPRGGLNIRADLFIRLIRLAGFSVGVSKTEAVHAEWPRSKTSPIIQSHDPGTSFSDPGFGLFISDDGNFNVKPFPNGDEPECYSLRPDQFSRAFGEAPRDYLSNEVIRILDLCGLILRIHN